MRTGVRLGIDVGRARIGVARCDPHGMLATPLETVPRDSSGRSDIARVLELAREFEAFEVIVGLPINLRGERTASTDDARAFGEALAARLGGTPVRLVDERLSTVSAQGSLREAGRRAKDSRGIIDQAAAVVILQHALDLERGRGEAPGVAIDIAARAATDTNGADA